MKNLWIFLGVLALVILSGCAGEAPPAPLAAEVDWCYSFNLNEDIGVMIDRGTRGGEGIRTDTDGVMIFSYQYDRDVFAEVAYVTVMRPFDVEGDITVLAEGQVFGITTNVYSQVMPADVDVLTLEFREIPTREGLPGFRDSIGVHLETPGGQGLSIFNIEVRGDGASPFPDNLCGGPTETPSPTIDPGTPFGSQTPTATGTAGPSPTPGPWSCFYDFTVSDQGWTPAGTFFTGTTRDSSGWHDVLFGSYRGASITVNLGDVFTINTITIDADHVPGIVDPGANTHQVYTGFITHYSLPMEDTIPQPLVLTDDYNIGVLGILFYAGYHGTDPGGSLVIHSVTIDGTGDRPSNCPQADVPTPTSGPTNTPGPTSTFEPLWGSCVDFTYADYLFVPEGASYVEGQGFVQEDDIWAVGRGSFGTTAKKKIKILFAPGQTFTGDVRLTDNGSNATDWNTVSGNSIVTDFSGDAWTPTNTFWLEMDGNNVPLTLTKICWLDPNPSTLTPGPGTGTALGTWTPLAATVTGTPGPSRTPISAPTFITTTPGVIIVPGTPFGTPPPGGTPGTGGSGSTNTGGGAGDAGEILGYAWSIGNGVFAAGSAYLGQVADAANGLFTAFTTATPTGIPGLPMCMSNPMSHDICAIYYILDFTIFAQGTPGALIIPFLLVIMNFYIVIRFIRWSMKLVRRTEGITDAN